MFTWRCKKVHGLFKIAALPVALIPIYLPEAPP
jgi:hypothetical protein